MCVCCRYISSLSLSLPLATHLHSCLPLVSLFSAAASFTLVTVSSVSLPLCDATQSVYLCIRCTIIIDRMCVALAICVSHRYFLFLFSLSLSASCMWCVDCETLGACGALFRGHFSFTKIVASSPSASTVSTLHLPLDALSS